MKRGALEHTVYQHIKAGVEESGRGGGGQNSGSIEAGNDRVCSKPLFRGTFRATEECCVGTLANDSQYHDLQLGQSCMKGRVT
jgi:hypothetical protein